MIGELGDVEQRLGSGRGVVRELGESCMRAKWELDGGRIRIVSGRERAGYLTCEECGELGWNCRRYAYRDLSGSKLWEVWEV